MSTGSVKFFNVEKSFGFVKQDSGDDLFFHVSETNGQEFKEGDVVEFEVGEGRKGPCATNLTLKN